MAALASHSGAPPTAARSDTLKSVQNDRSYPSMISTLPDRLGSAGPLAIALAASLTAASATAQTAPYTIIDIGDLAPPGEADGTNATGLNELGHVAAVTGDGSGPLGSVPVLFRDGQLIDLGGLPGGAPGGGAKGVNNLDVVAGWGLHPWGKLGQQSEPFLWTEAGGMINPLHGTPQGDWSGEMWDVNDAGQAVFTTKGGFWDSGTGFKQINFSGVGGSWRTWDLNEDGVVAGSAFGPSGQINAFRYDSASDSVVNLNDPQLDFLSDGYGINDLGDVAGWANELDLDRPAVIWTADGQTIRLPIGGLGPHQIDAEAEHINNHGDVVGLESFPGPSGGNPDFQPIGWVAFEATDGSPIEKQNLLDLLTPGEAAGWQRLHPFEINDRGEICGIAVDAGPLATGFARGFLMVPNTPDRFRNLSRALAGVNGHPVLIGRGTLEADTDVHVSLFKAAPNAPGFLVFSTGTSYSPVLAGVLVPDLSVPGAFLLPGTTDGSGAVTLSATWPAGFASGTDIVMQYWIVDAAGPLGVSASNAILQTTP